MSRRVRLWILAISLGPLLLITASPVTAVSTDAVSGSTPTQPAVPLSLQSRLTWVDRVPDVDTTQALMCRVQAHIDGTRMQPGTSSTVSMSVDGSTCYQAEVTRKPNGTVTVDELTLTRGHQRTTTTGTADIKMTNPGQARPYHGRLAVTLSAEPPISAGAVVIVRRPELSVSHMTGAEASIQLKRLRIDHRTGVATARYTVTNSGVAGPVSGKVVLTLLDATDGHVERTVTGHAPRLSAGSSSSTLRIKTSPGQHVALLGLSGSLNDPEDLHRLDVPAPRPGLLLFAAGCALLIMFVLTASRSPHWTRRNSTRALTALGLVTAGTLAVLNYWHDDAHIEARPPSAMTQADSRPTDLAPRLPVDTPDGAEQAIASSTLTEIQQLSPFTLSNMNKDHETIRWTTVTKGSTQRRSDITLDVRSQKVIRIADQDRG